MSAPVSQAVAREALRRVRAQYRTLRPLAHDLSLGCLSRMLAGVRSVSDGVAAHLGLVLVRGRCLTDSEVAAARARRRAGETLDEIAITLGVTRECISRRTRGCARFSAGELRARTYALRNGVIVPDALLPAYTAARRDHPQLTAA